MLPERWSCADYPCLPMLNYRVVIPPSPPHLARSQSYHKFFDLRNLGGGEGSSTLYRAWDLVKLREVEKVTTL